jgi:predicted outer membrane lipoprotein
MSRMWYIGGALFTFGVSFALLMAVVPDPLHLRAYSLWASGLTRGAWCAYTALLVTAAFVVVSALWAEHAEEKAAARQAAREAQPAPPVTLWSDCRGQCEGASVTREW